MISQHKQAIGAVCAAGMVALGGAFWWHSQEQAEQVAARARLTYHADGYGSFAKPKNSVPSAPAVKQSLVITPSPAPTAIPPALTTARAAYASGHYKAAEAAAKQVIASAPKTGHPTVAVASARHLLAFTAARQGDLKTARIRFAAAQRDAAALPAPSPTPPAPGSTPEPTLVEDSAYQHAVCTMALGDKAGAEREFVQFMRDYPDSPLVHGSMRRIARMHGGDIPKNVESVWRGAMAIAEQHVKQRERDLSLCGPECLSELLKRQGKTVAVEALAREMKTDENGSSVAALQAAFRRHGFDAAQGVRLTMPGLHEQSLPVVALIQPGHFVLVDAVAGDGAVTVWDGDNRDGATRTIPAAQWQQEWQGVALTTTTVLKTGEQVARQSATMAQDVPAKSGTTR